jgi:hypothetical protein
MNRRPPRLALSLLQRYVPYSEPLVGDIVETFAEHPSQLWLWRQVLAAVGAALVTRNGEIRPLQLVEQQPLDAIERTLEVHRRQRHVSPTPNPLPAGLGLVILGGLVTAMAPVIWWGLLITLIAGIGLAGLLVVAHKRRSPPSAARRLT